MKRNKRTIPPLHYESTERKDIISNWLNCVPKIEHTWNDNEEDSPQQNNKKYKIEK